MPLDGFLLMPCTRGFISCHFKVEGPLGVAWDMVLLRGKASIRSGEGCH